MVGSVHREEDHTVFTVHDVTGHGEGVVGAAGNGVPAALVTVVGFPDQAVAHLDAADLGHQGNITVIVDLGVFDHDIRGTVELDPFIGLGVVELVQEFIGYRTGIVILEFEKVIIRYFFLNNFLLNGTYNFGRS